MKLSRGLAIAFWSAVFATLILESVLFVPWTQTSGFKVLSTLVFTIIAFGWFLADSREHEVSPSPMLKIMVVAVSILAVPYYKFRYLGVRAGFVFLAVVIGSFIAVGVAAGLIGEIIYGSAAA